MTLKYLVERNKHNDNTEFPLNFVKNERNLRSSLMVYKLCRHLANIFEIFATRDYDNNMIFGKYRAFFLQKMPVVLQSAYGAATWRIGLKYLAR